MQSVIEFVAQGLADANVWQIVGFTFIVTHVTILSTTLFLHRSQTHRGVDFHPIVSHFFRFWLWLTTGIVTREWVAVHRKHHAKCEGEEDPHSPLVHGASTVLWKGAQLYRASATDQTTLDRYGRGTPNDWLEKNVYTRHRGLGIALMLAIDVALFGGLGVTVWAIQMAWIPFWAAGVINGLGHHVGYRNFSSADASTNLFPIGILIGGEELHNNHHAHGTSAKFSNKWYEFDLGWMYIRSMEVLRLATVRRKAPARKLKAAHEAGVLDDRSLEAVLLHRHEIMAKYAQLLKRIAGREWRNLQPHTRAELPAWRAFASRRWLLWQESLLNGEQRAQLQRVAAASPTLAHVIEMRAALARIWESTADSSEQLLHRLQAWCAQAERSHVQELAGFAQRLRLYTT